MFDIRATRRIVEGERKRVLSVVFDRSPYELGASFGASPRCSAIRVDAVCAPEHELPVLIPYNKTCVIDAVHLAQMFIEAGRLISITL